MKVTAEYYTFKLILPKLTDKSETRELYHNIAFLTADEIYNLRNVSWFGYNVVLQLKLLTMLMHIQVMQHIIILKLSTVGGSISLDKQRVATTESTS